jgi:hypothetical protein
MEGANSICLPKFVSCGVDEGISFGVKIKISANSALAGMPSFKAVVLRDRGREDRGT